MNMITIYTDGGCFPNPGPGGWAAIIKVPGGPDIELHGKSEGATTNNRMELTAAIRGLDYLTSPSVVVLVTDSQYLQRGASTWILGWYRQNWKRRGQGRMVDLTNADLWKRIWELKQRHQITWKWVRGHNGHAENERCDFLAGLRGALIKSPGECVPSWFHQSPPTTL